MKTIYYITLVLLCLSQTTFAQRIVEKNIEVKEDTDITLNFDFADEIHVSGWDKNTVSVKVTVNINNNQHNDNFSLEIDDHKWFIEISSHIENMDNLHYENITIRKEESSDYIVRDGKKLEVDLNYEVKIPREADLEISTISGDIILAHLNGELNIETVSGFIDLTLAENHNADLDMSTVTGGMYTNLELPEMKKNDMHHFGNRDLSTKLNGGGTDIELESVSGDIFLRKSK
jgi:hypothetical protein